LGHEGQAQVARRSAGTSSLGRLHPGNFAAYYPGQCVNEISEADAVLIANAIGVRPG
jgi:hypothetical protein